MSVTAATSGFRTLPCCVVKPITAATSADQRETTPADGPDAPKLVRGRSENVRPFDEFVSTPVKGESRLATIEIPR